MASGSTIRLRHPLHMVSFVTYQEDYHMDHVISELVRTRSHMKTLYGVVLFQNLLIVVFIAAKVL